MSLDFGGGTLLDFVAALRRATKEPVNIVLQPEVKGERVDEVSLRDVSVYSALTAALGTKLSRLQQFPNGTYSRLNLAEVSRDESGNPVFTVGMQAVGDQVTSIPGKLGGNSPSDLRVEVISIQGLVHADGNGASAPEAVVLSAIDTGLSLSQQPEAPKPEIQYHKDSGLLMVRGQAAEVGLVRDIVRQMTEDQQRRVAETRHRMKSEIRRHAEMQRAAIAENLAEQRTEGIKQRLGEIQALVASGAASRTDLSSAQMELAQATAELEMSRIEMDRLKREAEAGLDDDESAGGQARGEASTTPEVKQLRDELWRLREQNQQLQRQLPAPGLQNAAPPAGGKPKPKQE